MKELTPPRWKWTRTTVTIEFDIDWLLGLGDTLNEWKAWTGWTRRADCRNWKRSPIARENRRESITFANCLSQLMASLGRKDAVELMRRTKKL